MVRDALEDPVHGRRVQGEVRWKLHSLDHQLVLDRIPMNLFERKEEVKKFLFRVSLRCGATSIPTRHR